MTHTEMPSGYKIPENYENVAAVPVTTHSPNGIDPAWAVIELHLLGFHCVTATVDLFWNNYLAEGMDQDLIRRRRKKLCRSSPTKHNP